MSIEKEATVYKLEDIQKHTTDDDLWVLISDKVYDVSQLEHPGGREILLEYAGKDATFAFEDAGHSVDAREMMLDYEVGELCVEEKAARMSLFASPREERSGMQLVTLLSLGAVAAAFLGYQIYSRVLK